MKKAPKPYQVRTKRRNYNKLLQQYKDHEDSNSFNRSSRGSKAYYDKALSWYEQYLNRWQHLETIYLKTK